MTLVSDIITNDLESQLNDSGNVFWTVDILYKAITEAQNACLLLGVDANIVTEEFTLAQTSRQSLPSGGVRFIDVEGNVGGGSATRVSKKTMDDVIPGWMLETSATSIEHFLFDEEQPAVFWVYKKPSVGTIKINMSYAKAIPLITALTDAIVLSDLYLPAIKEYVLYKSFSMEGEGGNFAVAVQHLQTFYTLLGKKYQGAELLKAIQKNG